MDGARVPRDRGQRREFWRGHLKAWQAEGGTLRAYAESKGLCAGSLYRARRRLEGERSRPSPRLVPVRVTPLGGSSVPCRVHLPNGVVVELPLDEHASSVTHLLETLAGLT